MGAISKSMGEERKIRKKEERRKKSKSQFGLLTF
jgi:hypothetical protein